jgi:hypothetical protein
LLPRLGKNVSPSERRPIAWYAPPVLWQAGRELVSSEDFQRNSDRRESFSGPLDVVDLSREGQRFGFDFIADTGDGGNATFTVAAAASAARLCTTDGAVFARPDLVVLGGDLSYPAASSHDYHYRFLEVFSLAASGSSATTAPRAWGHVLSIPQNHDWFDSATTFCRHFVGRNGPSDLLGARTHQARTYFAALLPHRWWILGLDFAHKGDIDRAQYEAFVALFNDCPGRSHQEGTKAPPPHLRIRPDDNVILVYPVPYWTERLSQLTPEGYTLRYQRLEYWLEAPHGRRPDGQAGAGARIRLRLAGDLHHYARRSAMLTTLARPELTKRSALVTCGASGAFMHTTHGREIRSRVVVDASPAPNTEPESFGMQLRVGVPDGSTGPPAQRHDFDAPVTYPTMRTSRLLAWTLLPLSLFNPRFREVRSVRNLIRQWWESNHAFVVLVGVLYGTNAYVNSLAFSDSFAADGFRPFHLQPPPVDLPSLVRLSAEWVRAMFVSPFAVVINVAMIAGCVRLGWEGTWHWALKLSSGLVHGLLHGTLAMLLYYWISGLVRDSPYPFVEGFLEWVAISAVGGVVGALTFGLYFAVLNAGFGQLTNNASGAMAIEDYKGFLRCTLDEAGLTIRMMACDKVPRKWRENTASADDPRYVAEQAPAWRVVDRIDLEP